MQAILKLLGILVFHGLLILYLTFFLCFQFVKSYIQDQAFMIQ